MAPKTSNLVDFRNMREVICYGDFRRQENGVGELLGNSG